MRQLKVVCVAVVLALFVMTEAAWAAKCLDGCFSRCRVRRWRARSSCCRVIRAKRCVRLCRKAIAPVCCAPIAEKAKSAKEAAAKKKVATKVAPEAPVPPKKKQGKAAAKAAKKKPAKKPAVEPYGPTKKPAEKTAAPAEKPAEEPARS